MTACTFDGHETIRAVVPFSRVLRLWDASPELFDEDDTTVLFWAFTWVAAAPSSHPSISADQARALMDDMERRYRIAGIGTGPVDKIRLLWNLRAGLDIEDALARWLTSGRQEVSDCAACDTSDRAATALELGRFDEAARLASSQNGECTREPAGALFVLAEAELRRGHTRSALEALARARAAAEGSVVGIDHAWLGLEFEILSLTGHFDEAVRRLATGWPATLLQAETPLDRFEHLRGILAGMGARAERLGEPAPALPMPLGPIATLGDLRQWVRGEAYELAASFDRRNGTRRFVDALAAAEASRILQIPVPTDDPDPSVSDPGSTGPMSIRPLDPVDAASRMQSIPAPRDGGSMGAERPSESAVDTGAHDVDVAALLRVAECLPPGDERLPDAFERAAVAAETAGLLDDAGAAWAESAHAAQVQGQGERAHAAFARGAALLRAGDTPLPLRTAVLTARAPSAVERGDVESLVDLLIAEAADLETQAEARGADPEGGPGASPTDGGATEATALAVVQDTLARVLASAPEEAARHDLPADSAETLAIVAAEGFERLGMLGDAAHAGWVAARIRRDDGRAAAAETYETVVAAFGAARMHGERARAAGELIELLRELGDQTRAEAVVAALVE